MPLSRNLSLNFAAVPTTLPIPGEHLVVRDQKVDLENVPENGLILRNLYNSLDPYMRLMLIDPGTKHYRKPFALGEPLSSLAVGEVLFSRHTKFEEGTMIRTSLPIQEYSVLTSDDIESRMKSSSSSAKIKIIPRSSHILPTFWLGPLGMPGLTAYSSIHEIGKPKQGETLFVSSAAGAVGQIVGQIARLKGLQVIGSAGSKKKCCLLRDTLGFDKVFNYKEERTLDALNRLAPDGIDIYFDNVGGETLDQAIACMRKDGRVIVCGMVSQYNATSSQSTSEGTYGVTNLFQLVSQGLTMRGFQVGMKDFGPKYQDVFETDMTEWLVQGRVKVIMSEMSGIEQSADAFVGMLKGENFGKAVLNVKGNTETVAKSTSFKLLT